MLQYIQQMKACALWSRLDVCVRHLDSPLGCWFAVLHVKLRSIPGRIGMDPLDNEFKTVERHTFTMTRPTSVDAVVSVSKPGSLFPCCA